MSNKELLDAPLIDNIDFIELISINDNFRSYKARQQTLDRVVILEIPAHLSKESFEQFTRKLSICADFKQANLQQIIGQGVSKDEIPYAIIEYVEGKNLEEFLLSSEPLDFKSFKNLFSSLLTAMDCVHASGIAFGDITPDNILINDEAGNICGKFLIKSLLETVDDKASANNELKKKIKDNIYDIACLMYFSLLCEVSRKTFAQIKSELPDSTSTPGKLAMELGIPEALLNTIFAVLAKDSTKSPQSAADFAMRISSSLQDVTTGRAPQVQTGTVSRQRPNTKVILAVFLLLIPATIVIANMVQKKNSEQSIRIVSASMKESAEDLFRSALELSMKGQHNEALKKYEAALPGLTGKKNQAFECLISVASEASTVAEETKPANRDLLIKSRNYALEAMEIGKSRRSADQQNNTLKRLNLKCMSSASSAVQMRPQKKPSTYLMHARTWMSQMPLPDGIFKPRKSIPYWIPGAFN